MSSKDRNLDHEGGRKKTVLSTIKTTAATFSFDYLLNIGDSNVFELSTNILQHFRSELATTKAHLSLIQLSSITVLSFVFVAVSIVEIWVSKAFIFHCVSRGGGNLRTMKHE